MTKTAPPVLYSPNEPADGARRDNVASFTEEQLPLSLFLSSDPP